MNLKTLLVGVAGLAASFSVPAATIVTDSYTLTYDETTIFGDPTISSGPGFALSFGWSIPSSVNTGGGDGTQNVFNLPSFTITVNPGHTLSGPVSAFIGNLSYLQTGGASALGVVSGTMTLDGNQSGSMSQDLTKTPAFQIGGESPLETGFMSASFELPLESFVSLAFSDGILGLGVSASEGGVGVILGQPQNEFRISFAGAPIPIPAAGWLFATALCGLAVRRRQAA